SRFVMSYLEREKVADDWHQPPRPIHRQDRWILSRLNRLAADVQRHMEEYNFGEAQRAVHDFMWHEYADWYIEMAKIRLRNDPDGPSPMPYLAYVLEQILRLLHPFMPFITEELWQTLLEFLPPVPDAPEALIIAGYPKSDQTLIDDKAESEIDTVIEIVRAIRNMRAEFRIQPNQSVEAVVETPEIAAIAEAEADTIRMLARVDPLTFDTNAGPNGKPASSNDRVSLVLQSGTVTIPLGGLVDLDKERQRLRGEIDEIQTNHARLSARLQDDNFTSKAPEEVVDRERQRLEGIEERRGRVEEILSRLGG
ncbi:MAG: class I tRNA ligase family protein, partial [Chloroflexi bacterium]|nr:class I tRNA ligase family protein [Chloroflexota bacterium]